MTYTQFDLDTLALTVMGEARGETILGQQGVVWVARNRLKTPGCWSRERGDGIPDDTLAAVCRDPKQFSCWNRDDPNYFRMNDFIHSPQFEKVRRLCEEVLTAPEYEDPTNGADHYCTKPFVKKTSWARGRTPVAEIGNHVFFKIGL